MGTLSDYFLNRSLLIATQHGKEQVIAPLFEKSLGVRSFVPANYNTDQWGTFTGELERKHGPLETLRLKCMMAMEQYNCDLGVASEGSFGPHPGLLFVPADDELVILIDQKHGLEIVARELSTATNFDGAKLSTTQELLEFAQRVEFPSHRLILRAYKKSKQAIIKGIGDWETLRSSFDQLIEKYGVAYAETDMRAMYNPSRMKVIESAAIKLLQQLNSQCPACGVPGYWVVEVKPGLPCERCGYATKSTYSHIYACKKCKHVEEISYPNNKFFEEPTYCDLCNP